MLTNKVTVLTQNNGVMSDYLQFTIINGVPHCQYSYSSDSVLYPIKPLSDDSPLVEDYNDLARRIDEWKIDGEKPRDNDGNVIPFRW